MDIHSGNGNLARRIAAIDIGTNSFHAVIVDISPDGTYSTLDKLKEMVLLGREGLGRKLPEAAMKRGLEALQHFKTLCDSYKVEHILAYATSAIREAENGGEFIQRVIDEIGIKIMAIPGLLEAELIGYAVQNGMKLGTEPTLIMDIGGGSTEFIIANSREFFFLESKKIGVSRIYHDFVKSDPISKKDITALEEHYSVKLSEVDRAIKQNPTNMMVGTSGTMQNIATMIAAMKKTDVSVTLNEFEYSADDFKSLYKKVIDLNRKQRQQLPGLDSKRVDLIVPGLILINNVIKKFGITRIKTSTQAMREGIIIRYIRREYKDLKLIADFPDPRRRSLFELLRKCNWHEDHSSHVATLALKLFDDLKPWHDLTVEDRELLEFGSLVHDIGYHISHHKHHKHGLYIILNAELKGFTQEEIEILGHLARYHRRSTPKSRHKQYELLNPDQKRRIKALCGFLRVADGLDRSHFQNVQDLKILVENSTITLKIKTLIDPQLEIWGAMRKREMFEKLFGRELKIERVKNPKQKSVSDLLTA